jgi:hypothetical protein
MSQQAAGATTPSAREGVSTVEPSRRWGLLPEPGPDGKVDPGVLLRYWFVQFNPLYFVSAFCVLYGVFLVARNIDSLATVTPERAQLVLFTVIQAYEALLIAGAAFLVHRAGTVRPAVLLAMLETLFVFDCTFRLEGLALIGPLAAPLVLGLWLLLTLAKVGALAAALRVTLTRWHYASILATATGMVGVITLLSRPDTSKVAVLQAAAGFGTFVLLALEARRPALFSRLVETAAQNQLAERCFRGVFRLLAGAYFYHVWSYILLAATADIKAAAILPQAGAFFLLYAIIRRSEKETWAFGVLAVVSVLPTAAHLPYALFVIAAVFAYRAWGGARGGLAAGAAFAVYGGVWLAGWPGGDQPVPPLPAILSWQSFSLGFSLALIGWFLRDPFVWALVGAGILYGAYRTIEPMVPKSELGLGVLLVGAGFLAFLIGIAINWWFRGSPRKPEPAEALVRGDDSPGANAGAS